MGEFTFARQFSRSFRGFLRSFGAIFLFGGNRAFLGYGRAFRSLLFLTRLGWWYPLLFLGFQGYITEKFKAESIITFLWEAAKKVLFLVAQPLRPLTPLDLFYEDFDFLYYLTKMHYHIRVALKTLL